jgi:hypothetical protein
MHEITLDQYKGSNIEKGFKPKTRDIEKILIGNLEKGFIDENLFIKAINEYDLIKSVALIGEIREWKGGKFKKIKSGEWVKIEDSSKGVKEKNIAVSSMKKHIKEEILNNKKISDDIRSEFIRNFDESEGSGLQGIIYKVKLSRFLEEKFKDSKEYAEIRKKVKDLNDELEEINVIIEQKAKEKRELKTGKKEIGVEDEGFVTQMNSFRELSNETRKLPDYVNPQDVAPFISVDDYWLNTDAVFKEVFTGQENWQEIDDKWEGMKKSGEYEFTHSPKSSSQYLINRKTGDVFRFADHWGRCASCFWDSNFDYGIGCCNIKDFKRNYGSWVNKEKVDAQASAAKTVIDELHEMVNNNKIYLTKGALKKIKEYAYEMKYYVFKSFNYNTEMIEDYIQKYKELFND